MELISESDKIKIRVYDLLKTVIDPELGVNIVDLGLVYKIEYTNEEVILIDITLSSRGCPMGEVIMENIGSLLQQNFPEKKQSIRLVWEPQWSPSLITQEGKKLLNL